MTDRESNNLEMAIARIDTDGVLGAIALRVNSSTMSANIGYWLTPEARGHGYTTMALGLVCGWLFDTCDLGRIDLTTDPENYASQRVAQRCGFRLEGLLRSHLLHPQTGVGRRIR